MTTMMSPAALLLLLACFLHLGAEGAVGPALLFKEDCCLNVTRMAIPLKRIRRVAAAASGCGAKAIIVTTVCDKKFCLDGSWLWAKKRLEEFQKAATGADRSPRRGLRSAYKCNSVAASTRPK